MDSVSKLTVDDADWQNLHRRAVMGETLNAVERQAYEARLEELDAQEKLDGDLALLRTLRVEIVNAEREQQRLREFEARRNQCRR